jgi:hypothetical protein
MKPMNFYEVTDHRGDAVWGGISTLQAVEWFRRGLDYKVFVSVWDEEDIEEPRLITDKIEVTNLIQATLFNEREKE